MNEQGTAGFYLPGNGVWTDIQTGERYEAGKFYRRVCDYFQMPILAKPNSIIAFGNYDIKNNDSFVYDYLEDVKIIIYELENEKKAETILYDEHSTVLLHLKAERRGDCITVSFPPTPKRFQIIVGKEIYDVSPGESEVVFQLL